MWFQLVSCCFKPSQSQKDYIRAEGDFYEKIYSWKDQWGRNKTGRSKWESGELLLEFIKMKYSWKGHKDRNRQEQNKKVRASWVVLYQRHKPQHPHLVKVSPRGQLAKNRYSSEAKTIRKWLFRQASLELMLEENHAFLRGRRVGEGNHCNSDGYFFSELLLSSKSVIIWQWR